MAIKALNPNETWDYVPKSERGSERPFKAKLRALNNEEKEHIENILIVSQGGGNAAVRSGTYNTVICKFGIIGWENLEDHEGNPVEFREQKSPLNGVRPIADETLIRRYFPRDLVAELATAIEQKIKVEPEDLGNSPSPS